jgi:ABC-type transport system involved in cytochrome bd biosynthesis fused ATPase/permease subunit
LLMDEPYAGLDDEAKTLVDRTIEEARTGGRTVVLATHDLTRGATADRVLFMDRGRLLPELTNELSEGETGR